MSGAVYELEEKPRLRRGYYADMLQGAFSEGAAMALWIRTMPDGYRDRIDGLVPSAIPSGRRRVTCEAVGRACADLLSPLYPVDPILHDFLHRDMAEQSLLFARMMGEEEVDIRLDHVTDDACCLFHEDAVRWRMIVTYRGPGTDYVLPEDSAAARANQRDYDGPLFRVPRFSVALFRGALAGGRLSGGGILHRSPRIEGTGERRLVLCLNAPMASSPERTDYE